jgi:hypothetical protein
MIGAGRVTVQTVLSSFHDCVSSIALLLFVYHIQIQLQNIP